MKFIFTFSLVYNSFLILLRLYIYVYFKIIASKHKQKIKKEKTINFHLFRCRIYSSLATENN